jgi:CBS domain-containing protein
MPSGPTRRPLPDATIATMNSLHELLVADVMSVEPVTVAWDAFVEDAERLMRAQGISGLPVLDGNRALVGVISQSDVLAVRGMAIGAVVRHRPSGVRVGEVMSSPAITVPITCSLVEAARRMRDARVHRLVAVDEHSRPAGVLSASDYVGIVADS